MFTLKIKKSPAVSKNSKKQARKAPAAQPSVPAGPRRLHLPAYKPFRFKRIKYPERLPSSWKIARKTIEVLWRRRWLFLGIAAIYGVLNLIFVRGLSGGVDIDSLKQQFNLGLGGNTGQLVTGLTVFTSLLASSGNDSSATAGAYQFFLGIVVSLAVIWAMRQTVAGQKVRVRDTFYQGMYPLIPFLLVLVVVLLQTLPFIIGGGLYTIVVINGIAATGLEQLLWGLLFLTLTVISVYMLCSSVFALYIVTLPDMTPMKALRSARQLVRYRRGQVFPKLLYLPVMMLLIAGVIMVPLILFAAVVAQWVFFVLSMAGLVVLHAFMYTFYKELLA